MNIILWIGIIASLSCAACSQGFEVNKFALGEGSSGGPGSQPPVTPPVTPDLGLGICSQLDFSGVSWPGEFERAEKKAMALALNVTGSFEGAGGWENLAGNFDGQGLSLGLNQQNLGQGTLQPILKTMIEENAPLAQMLFSPANLRSMTAMINKWSQSTMIESLASHQAVELFPDKTALTKLDDGFEQAFSVAATRNSESVSWAVDNLFQRDGKTFKTDWQQSLRSFAVTAPFRSLQIQEATAMFERAIGYFVALNLNELRSLLLMYDFVVQNGGFNSDHLAQLRSFDRANPMVTEQDRMLKLLAIRLVSVRPQFRADVDSRKRTIINSVGRVHGRTRDLQKEYCFRSAEAIEVQPNLARP